MAFYELKNNAVSRGDLLSLKSNLVAARNFARQVQAEAVEMDEAQIQNRYGLSVSQVAFMNIIDEAVTALETPAIETIASQMGPAGDVIT